MFGIIQTLALTGVLAVALYGEGKASSSHGAEHAAEYNSEVDEIKKVVVDLPAGCLKKSVFPCALTSIRNNKVEVDSAAA